MVQFGIADLEFGSLGWRGVTVSNLRLWVPCFCCCCCDKPITTFARLTAVDGLAGIAFLNGTT